MNSSRFIVLLAVVVAFLAGVGVGYFVAVPATVKVEPAAPAIVPALERKGHEAKINGNIADGKGTVPLAGDEGLSAAAQRFWSVLTIADERERQAAWLKMLSELSPADTLQVRDLFRRMEKQGRGFPFEWSAFWPRWGEVDAKGALVYLENNEWPSWRPNAAEMILRGWAKSDPASARAWLEANPKSPWFDGALRGYLDGLARQDLDRATNEVGALGTGRPLSGFMEVLTEQALRQRQLGGMVSWWESLPDDPADGSARREAIGHVYWRLQGAEPARAAEWLASLASTPFRSDQHIGEFAEKIMARDPAAAVEWVSNLPPNPTDGRYTAIGRTVTALARQDAAALETWLQKLPASPLRDQATAAYVSHLEGARERDRALKWKGTVADQSVINQRTRDSLLRIDPSPSGGAPPAPQ